MERIAARVATIAVRTRRARPALADAIRAPPTAPPRRPRIAWIRILTRRIAARAATCAEEPRRAAAAYVSVRRVRAIAAPVVSTQWRMRPTAAAVPRRVR